MGDLEYACKTVLRELNPAVEFTGPMPMDAMLFKLLSEDYRQKRGICDPKRNFADRAFFSTGQEAGAKTLLESYA